MIFKIRIDMHYTQQQLLDYLDMHQITYQMYSHAPVFTCEQALEIITGMNIKGKGIKNLFLKDNKKKFYHIVATDTTHIDLKSISSVLEAKGLRFADATLLMNYLGVEPGSVTPFALINDRDQSVQAIIDADVLKQEYVQVHPLKNDATIVVTPTDLIKFFNVIGRSYIVYDFTHNQIVI